MLVTQYNDFVHQTDQYKDRSKKERWAIALYGLVGEIGSLVSAVKKRLLAEDGQKGWNQSNEEILEELGDVVWYCFSLAQIENAERHINILVNDIALLKREIGDENERAKKIHAALDPSKKEAFLKAAEDFPATKNMTLSDYQTLAFLTARTEGQELLTVCLAVLWQLGAELLRKTLPEIELTLNKNVNDRQVNVVLGEIAWHLSAIASLYGVSLNDIVERNVRKVTYRSDDDGCHTPLHDQGRDESEQIPRVLEVAFVSVGSERLQMYLAGRRLGDELTDNSYDDDGYRFHDVMHLSNAAHLGWSPVLRKLLGKKRKSDKKIDRVEDGARAQIVEELVLKAIHSEGVRIFENQGGPTENEPMRHFPTKSSVNFRLLKSLNTFVKGLESEKNKFWEWRNAILQGADVFYNLRRERQGTVTIDLVSRKLTFSPDVCVDLKGLVVGLGSATVDFELKSCDLEAVLTPDERAPGPEGHQPDILSRMVAAKLAIFDVLGFGTRSDAPYQKMSIKLRDNNRVCVKAFDEVIESIWERKILTFQLTFTTLSTMLSCTALGVADPQGEK